MLALVETINVDDIRSKRKRTFPLEKVGSYKSTMEEVLICYRAASKALTDLTKPALLHTHTFPTKAKAFHGE